MRGCAIGALGALRYVNDCVATVAITRVDYDQEMALVAVDELGAAASIVGVAGYIIIEDRELGGIRRCRRRC